ncbi:DUF2972 domain-containing protein, partial [Campylobacter coli]|nr:DUF2972 domain-containing protein [Campylobacter coli]
SLLDPKKLNNDTEEINYKNIPAELAWEMNLPLPDKYDFIFISSHGTGEKAFQEMLARCDGVKVLQKNKWYDNGKDRYKAFYKDLVIDCTAKKCIPILECNFLYYGKYLHMFGKKVPLICLVRDPIKMVASIYNYKVIKDKQKLHFSNKNNNEVMFDNYFYTATRSKSIIDLNELKKRIIHQRTITSNIRFTYIAKTHIQNLKNMDKVYYVDSSEISASKAYLKLKEIGDIVGFSVPEDSNLINKISFTHYLRFIFDIDRPIIYTHQINPGLNLQIFIFHMYQQTERQDITYLFNLQQYDSSMHNIFICTDAQDYDIIIHDEKILYEIRDNILNFFNKINNHIAILRKEAINEEDILKIYKEDKQTSDAFKKLIKDEFKDILEKESILKKWNYYLKFIKL